MTSSQNSPTELQTETINAKSYVATLLHRLVSERLLITVSMPDKNSPTHTSTLLQVLPNEGVFLLDDLFPQPPSESLPAGTELHFAAAFDGVNLSFKAKVETVNTEQGLRTFRLKLPESVEYQHARDEHRVDLTALDIAVSITIDDSTVLKGRLHDVSSQGISVVLSRVNGLKRGKNYRCSIDHSDDETVEIEIEPNRVDKIAGNLPIKLGARLSNMNRHDMLSWQHFAAELERRLLRQQ